MNRSIIVAITLFFAFLTGCSLGTSQTNIDSDDFTLVSKWYTNSEDDRYYVEFRNDGTLYHRYYQYYGSIGSGLNGFVTKIGDWRYLDELKTRFSVGWDDSLDRYYDVLEVGTDEITIEKNSDGPVGRGLGDITVLLRAAAHVTYVVPDEIVPLMGTWYYDESKVGESLRFQEDGTCLYHYYQDYGGNLSGWVNISGSWNFVSEDGVINITMSGEITYPYILDILTLDTLFLELPENRPGGTSMIYSGTYLFK